jgi:hypothetical protein
LTQITIFSGLTDTAGERKATTWERIAGTLTDHKPGERDGSLFSGCTFNGRRARANVEARGLYCLDIEASKTTGEIPPTPEETAALIAARGWRGVIYTTWNHTAEMPRFRVVLQPERQIEMAGDVDAVVADGAVTLGLAKMIGLEGVIDRTKICAESMFYLPRHGAERAYFATEIPGEPIDGATLAEARRIGEQLLRDDDVIAEAASAPEQRGNSVIAAYNASVTVAALLEQYGYRRKPRSLVDWRSPYQQSDSYATRVFDSGRFVTLSASDIAAGIGRPGRGGAAAFGDAFDLYTAYEHRGDQRAAMRAAARLLGLDAKKPRDEWHDAAGGADADGESESGAEGPKPSLLHIRRVDAFTAEYEPAEYLIDYMLQTGFLYSLTAETGAGKTALMILVSALVATGKPFGQAEVKRGNVIYCVGENADEFRQRMICLRENSFDPPEYDGIHVLTPESHKGLLTPAGTAEVASYAKALGGVDLVVVDTAAAFFDGDEENSNTELGEYARRLRRRLCTLPGKPCVVVCSHPTKNAKTHDELVPRGGGAFVAEVDGNLTLMKKDVGASEMFWSKKFRGRIDNPVQIALTPVEAQKTVDAKGRPLRSVLAGVTETVPAEAINAQKLRDRVIRLMADGKTRTVEDVALAALEMLPGQPARNDTPGYRKTGYQMEGLRKMGLLERIDGRWRVTTKGKRHAQGLTGGPANDAASDTEDEF